jgi:hypothetical protein
MSDLSPRSSRPPSRRPSRRQREQRAYALTLATGGLALASVVVLVLAIANVVSFGLFVLLAVLAALAGYLLKRALNP